MINDVERADHLVKVRIWIFYLMALCFTISTVESVGEAPGMARIWTWVLLGTVTALNLTSIGGWLRPRAVTALLNDESTREHRQISLRIGFWTALCTGLAIFAFGAALPITASDAGRIITCATLVPALVTFASLEWRAARG